MFNLWFRRARRLLPLGLLAWAACMSVSCSRGTKACYPVHGQVLLEGQPVRGAVLVFHPLDDADPNAVKPRAFADRDGKFKVSTYRTEDGAPAGRYAITIVRQFGGMGGQGPGQAQGQGQAVGRQRANRGSARWQALAQEQTRRQWDGWVTGRGPGGGRFGRGPGGGPGGGPGAGTGRGTPPPNPGPPEPLPARYESDSTSGLVVEVQKKDNELEPFNLEK
jgi:hypothetical protein